MVGLNLLLFEFWLEGCLMLAFSGSCLVRVFGLVWRNSETRTLSSYGLRVRSLPTKISASASLGRLPWHAPVLDMRVSLVVGGSVKASFRSGEIISWTIVGIGFLS